MDIPNVESLFLYFNIAMVVFLVLGALFGFLKGFFKSTYNLAVFVGLLIIGIIISPIFVKIILNFDISSVVDVDYDGVIITSLSASITPIAEKIMPELAGKVVPGTEMYELVYQLMVTISRLIFIIVWYFLTISIFKFISWIVYLIIRPRKKNRKKKTLNSRLLGMGIGFVHVVVVMFIISIPMGGITSLAASAQNLIPSNDEGDLAFFEEETPLIDLASGDSDELMTLMIDFSKKLSKDYRKTVIGGISGFIKIDGEGLDERFFSSLFSVKYNKQNIRLTSELKKGLSIYSLIEEKIDEEISIQEVLSLDEETLNYIIDTIKELKIINIIPPVGLEFAYLTGELDMITQEDYQAILTEIKAVNFSNDISSIADVGVKAGKLGLLEKQETDYYLNLDVDKVKELFIGIGSLELLDAIDSFAFDLLLNMPEVNDALINANIDPEEINLSNVSLGDEVTNLGNIYEAFVEMKIAYNDETQTVNLELVSDDSINLFSTAIYESLLFSQNINVLTNILIEQLPAEYRDVLTIDIIEQNDFVSILSLGVILIKTNILSEEFDFTDLFGEETMDKIATHISNSHLLADNINGVLDIILTEADLPFKIDIPGDFTWYGDTGKTELKALLGSAGQLFELGIAEENFVENLNSTNIEELSDVMDDSVILMHNMNNLLDFVIGESGINDTVTITIRDIDWESTEGKEEFRNILGSVALIFEAKLLDNPNLAELSDGTIDTNEDGIINEDDDNIINDLAKKLSSSIIIKDNLSSIIDQLVTTEIPDLEFETFTDPDDWTETELDSIFRSVKIIITKENIPEDLFALSENEIDTVLSSRLIGQIFVKTIEKEAEIGGSLHGLLIVQRAEGNWYDQYLGEVRVDGELRKLVKSAKILLGDNPNFDDPDNILDINAILDLTDAKLDELTNSIVLKDSISNQIIDLGNEEIIVVSIPQFDNRWNDEIPNFIKGIKTIVGEEVDLDNLNIDVNNIKNLTDGTVDPSDDEIGVMLSSLIISDTIIDKIIDLGETSGTLVVNLSVNDPRWYDTETEDGEIRKLIKAIKIFIDEEADLNDSNSFDINKIRTLTDGSVDPSDDEIGTMLSSLIISDTIIDKIIDLGDTSGTLIVNLSVNDPRWYDTETEDGEIRKLIKALKVLIGEEEDINNPSSIDVNTIKTLSDGSIDPNDDEIGTMLSSLIISDTIIDKIIGLGDTGGSLVVNLTATDARWYDTETEDGEIRRLIKTLKLLIGETGDLNDPSVIDIDEIISLDETAMNTLVTSIIIVDTAVNSIEDLTSSTGSLNNILIVPDDLTNEDYYGINGELKRFLTAVKTIRGAGTLENTTFNVDKFLGEDQETLLNSRIIEASAISYILSSDKLLIPDSVTPYYYLSNEDIVWERTYSGETLEDIGELRRFLSGVKTLVGVNTFADLAFDMNTMLAIDFTDVVKSRVLEATITDMVTELIETGPLNGLIKQPSNNYQWYYHETSNDVNVGLIRRGEFELTNSPTYQYSDLLGFLNAIQQMDSVGLNFNSVDMNTIAAINSTDLATAFWDYSRITRGSVATILNYVLKDVNHPLKPTFTDSQFSDKQDVIDGLDIFKYFVSLM
ncbi:MAG: hypothetical protein WC927_02920 [Bacilli bacterium]|jgi:hypothetical protein